MAKMSWTDFQALKSCQQSLAALKPFLDKKDETADALSDVWNTLLDCRTRLVHKILDDPIMSYAGLDDQILSVLQDRARASSTRPVAAPGDSSWPVAAPKPRPGDSLW